MQIFSSKTPVLNNINLTQDNYKATPKILMRILITLIILVGISTLLKPTIVLDKKTLRPISGATVNYYHFGMQGCSSGIAKSTHLGVIFSPLGFSRCQVTVKLEGYHLAGANNITALPGLLGARIILMNKITDPQELIKFKKVFTSGEGMDVISYLKDLDVNAGNEKIIEEKNDFTLNGNVITFYENGGVQAVSRDETGNDGGSLFYDLDNVITAPVNGYKKELEIVPGKSYVARLRDGEHYMLFYMFRNGMTAFVNPKATRNMEAGKINPVCGNLYTDIYSNDFTSETCYSGEYDLKIKYSELIKEVEGDHLHLLNPYLSGFAFYVKEIGTKYCFYLSPNENRYTAAETASLIGLDINTSLISIKLPPYNLFKKYYNSQNSCLSVDVFVNGSYARD